MIRKTMRAAALAAVAAAGPAHAVDGVSTEFGYNSDNVRLWRVGLQWKWQRRWFVGGSGELGGYWDLSGGGWKRSGEDTVYDIGLTPVFRFEGTGDGSPYVEAAIGFHLLSDLQINDDRIFSTNFQFGDHVAIGRRFGPQNRHDLSLRLQHLSNGGIRKPNPGINFLQVRFQYHLK